MRGREAFCGDLGGGGGLNIFFGAEMPTKIMAASFFFGVPDNYRDDFEAK